MIFLFTEWELLMLEGNDVWYQYLASLGDPDYSKFWALTINEPENTVAKTIREGVNKIGNGPSVFHALETMLKRHFLDEPPDNKIKIFGRGNSIPYTIIFTENSPLKPIFSQGIKKVISNCMTICSFKCVQK